MPTQSWSMRPSRVLDRLRRGETVSAIKLNLGDPRIAEIAARSGYDAVWLDFEHVPNDTSVVENMIRAAKVYNVDAIVRVRRGSYTDLTLPLEMDAAGIMVPHVMDLSDAESIVKQTRFHPLGRRPWDGGNSDGGYCMVPPLEYIKSANEQRLVILQIEDPEAMEHLDEIAGLDGIDMLFFGPGDFSQGIGAPGQFDHPLICEARERVAEACKKAGKFAGTLTTPQNAEAYRKMGYQFLSLGADIIGLTSYCTGLLSQMGNDELETPPKSNY